MIEVIKMDKKSAATCQIDTAIDLFYEKKDVISILSLSYSAWGIIKNMVKPEHRSVRQAYADYQVGNGQEKNNLDAWKKMDEIWSFIKHAKNDSHSSYQFPSSLQEIVLFSVIHDYIQLYGDCSENMRKYYFRWVENNKGALSDINTTELADYLRTLDNPMSRFRWDGNGET